MFPNIHILLLKMAAPLHLVFKLKPNFLFILLNPAKQGKLGSRTR